MAHNIAVVNGKASIAFVGDTPWHGLGQQLTEGATIETWQTEAGMDWSIEEAPVQFTTPEGLSSFEGSKVLYRSDTKEALSIVGHRYKIVQPGEVLEFFRDLTQLHGMKLHTAGVLMGGRRFWALADTGRAADILKNDRVKGMLLLTTGCDGMLATSAMFTATRVVCNNTLNLAMQKDGRNASRVTHRSVFDPKKLKHDMGLLDHAWENFIGRMNALSKVSITDRDARKFVEDLIKRPGVSDLEQPYTVGKETEAILNRYKNGMGADKTYGTAWGLLNGITEHFSHEGGKTRSKDKVLWNSWFGKAADLKTEAYARMEELV